MDKQASGRATTLRRPLALALLAGVLGIAAAAWAQPGGAQHGMMGRHGPPPAGGEAFMLERLAALRNKLSLTPEQGALWDAAQQLAGKTREEARPQWQAGHQRLMQALDSGSPTPRELFAEMDKQHEAMRAKHLAVREAWLKVYEALNPNQQAIVRLDFKERMQRMPMGGRGGPPARP
jgi:Spy/CpxP family protein refolding chaperone